LGNTRDYRYWLYEHQHNDVGEFFSMISNIVENNRVKINILLITTQEDLLKEFHNWLPEKYRVESINNVPIFTIRLSKEGHQSIKVVFVRHPHNPTIYFALSDCKSGEFKEIFTNFINKYFPTISRIFLTNNELYRIFHKIKELGYNVLVEFSVGKKRLSKTQKESYIRYTNKPYAEVFDEMYQHDQWVQSIRYRADLILNDGSSEISFRGTISRDCYFSAKKNISSLIHKIIPEAIQLASVRNEHLKLSAESAQEPKPKPTVINFEENVFEDISKNQSYVDALAELPSCSVSEYHTNPYIHLSLVDYLDGSSYDIWVVSSDRMVIIPQFSASNASIRRVVNHIFERIHDGVVEKYEKIVANSQY